MCTPIEPATLDWLTVVKYLVPAFFGFVGVWAGGYLTHKQVVTKIAADAENEKRTRRRERLEALYIEFDRWATDMENYYRTQYSEMTGYSVSGTEQALQSLPGDADSQHFYMIAEIYFHGAHDQMAEIIKIQSKFEGFLSSFLYEHEESGDPSTIYAIHLDKALQEFEKCCKNYLSLLAARVRELD